MTIDDLTTPALLVDAPALEHNLTTMSAARPGKGLRPHIKAHKCTALASLQAKAGHQAFTCATIRVVEGMAAAGLGEDLLLANEVLDAHRLMALNARVTVAVDSEATIAAAARAGVREVVIDVNIGLPRCGCRPEDARHLAELCRSRGLTVRGVMGYEGHAAGIQDREVRAEMTRDAVALLESAHQAVGGEVVSAGATGTYDLHSRTTEVQAGSYVLMDTEYAKLDLPFRQALSVLATVISVSAGGGYAVADCGLKALGMDHGPPAMEGDHQVLLVSDEHLTFAPAAPVSAGERLRVLPAHVDPTVAYHERMHLVLGREVLESWPVDLRGW